MFTGKARVDDMAVALEELAQSVMGEERNRSGFVEDSVMPSESVHKTDDFGKVTANANQYRVVLSGDHFYLEQLKYNHSSVGAYAYAGVMFPSKDLPAIAEVLRTAKEEYDEKFR